MPEPDPAAQVAAHRLGRRLQWATIAWNMMEVFITVGLGIAARSLALVAFGLDSLIEVFASLVVIWHMQPPEVARQEHRDRRAMRLVAAAFAVLALVLIVASTLALVDGTDPDGSPLGVAYLATTALVMFGLAALKRRVGRELASDPFLAEASMTFLDGCLATSVLVALAANIAFGWWWADPLAALVVAAFAAREAREGWLEASG